VDELNDLRAARLRLVESVSDKDWSDPCLAEFDFAEGMILLKFGQTADAVKRLEAAGGRKTDVPTYMARTDAYE
jgi:hypothetical protein